MGQQCGKKRLIHLKQINVIFQVTIDEIQSQFGTINYKWLNIKRSQMKGRVRVIARNVFPFCCDEIFVRKSH